MSLFNLPKEQRVAYVAKCLGYNDDPKTWDIELIDRVINEVEKECHRAFMRICNQLMHRF